MRPEYEARNVPGRSDHSVATLDHGYCSPSKRQRRRRRAHTNGRTRMPPPRSRRPVAGCFGHTHHRPSSSGRRPHSARRCETPQRRPCGTRPRARCNGYAQNGPSKRRRRLTAGCRRCGSHLRKSARSARQPGASPGHSHRGPSSARRRSAPARRCGNRQRSTAAHAAHHP